MPMHCVRGHRSVAVRVVGRGPPREKGISPEASYPHPPKADYLGASGA
jgi:hypothetical protein